MIYDLIGCGIFDIFIEIYNKIRVIRCGMIYSSRFYAHNLINFEDSMFGRQFCCHMQTGEHDLPYHLAI